MASFLSKKQIYVATGNPNKAKNSLAVLSKIFDNVSHYSLELPEIQSLDLEEVVRHKLQFALGDFKIDKNGNDRDESENSYLIVEDISLEFEALGRLPGTFIKFFCSELGLDKMCRLLDGLEGLGRKAKVKCVIGLAKIGEKNMENAKFFSSELNGEISNEPKGNGGFGFDKIFIPEGYNNKTAGELNGIEYSRYFAEIRKYENLMKN
ncbi:MAG: non-canonical purine NTP pyrophosphatase [Firmicutes bacterium]|nr:non-canonical purine NTP pyrophosphatase [Bacillota bacterium]